MHKTKGTTVSNIEDLNKEDSLKLIQDYYNNEFLGPFSPPLDNKPLFDRDKYNCLEMGTLFWKLTFRHNYLSDLLRNTPNDKAMGPDYISDKWFRKKQNSYPFHDWI